eukprot:m.63973 g.63973  ORF g.63973 m.63973 type:complete len:91 (+) comp9691_c0_seq3:1610-1882(+)
MAGSVQIVSICGARPRIHRDSLLWHDGTLLHEDIGGGDMARGEQTQLALGFLSSILIPIACVPKKSRIIPRVEQMEVDVKCCCVEVFARV